MRENGTICPFGVFPQLYCILYFASKWAIFPLKRSVWGVEKGHFRDRKGQMVDSGFQDPKPAEIPLKQGEHTSRPQLSQHRDWPQNLKLGQKLLYNSGKNAKRTNGSIFARPCVHA